MKNIPLPIGVENYKAACSCYYIDKTVFLKDLIDLPETSSLLISRPRRFGKSLALSMVEHFFSPEKADPALFEDKRIWDFGEDYRSQLGSGPVVRISLKDVIATSFEAMASALASYVASLYWETPILNEVASEEEKRRLQSLKKGLPRWRCSPVLCG